MSLKFAPKDPIGLTPNGLQAIIGTNADPIHWRIHAALGEDELKHS